MMEWYTADSGENVNLPRRIGIIAGILCIIVLTIIDIRAISRSSNSTAGIAYIFLPFVVGVLSIPAFVGDWCFGYFLTWFRSPIRWRKLLAIAAGLVPVAMGAWVVKTVSDKFALTPEVHQVLAMNSSQLESIVNKRGFANSNKFVFGAIAQNPNATANVLHRVAILNRPELYEPMGSHYDVMGTNTKGLAVMRLVARNPNTSPEDMEILATSTNEYVLGDVAYSPKLSEATLQKLINRGGYLIESGLARNPKTPQETLSRLAESQNEYTRGGVAANPGTTMDILTALSTDSMFHVRSAVAMNPSTPLKIVEQLLDDSDGRVRSAAIAGKSSHRSISTLP